MALFTSSELAIIALLLDEDEQQKGFKKCWVHDAWTKREEEGEFVTLYKHLIDDETKFFEYFRMSQNCFNILHNRLKKHITKRDTHWRKAGERLAVCLRFLATGDSFKTISFSFRLGHSTVQEIVSETCKSIVQILLNEYIPKPTEEMWRSTANEFYNMWDFPNCLGALDGKHVTIQAPAKSGSLYYNYKKTFSIVLLALVDANYNFITVNVGSYGKSSDGGIFGNSKLGKALQRGTLSVPADSPLPGTTTMAPYVLVGDEAFPLKNYLMRPYPGENLDVTRKVFNYRLSRARRVVENAFGILSQKFRIYQRRIQVSPANADNVILSTCILHNFIKKFNNNICSHESQQNKNILNPLPMRGGNASSAAFSVRDQFKNYFNSDPGWMEGQEDRIFSF